MTAAPGRPGRDLGCPVLPPWGGTPKAERGLQCPRRAEPHTGPRQPHRCGAGVEQQHGDVGHRVLRDRFVGCRTLVPRVPPVSFPPSLLCGCWAQPLGLVKQQDRSRLGKRGTGESLNKEFLIWNRLRPVACFLPHPAVLSTMPHLSPAAPHHGGFTSGLIQELLRDPVLGLRAPLHCPGLSCPFTFFWSPP